MIDIRYPNITAANEAAQLLQVKSYLHQLVDQLNIALKDVENTAVSASAPAVKSASEIKAEKDNEAQSTFSSIKALIIKSADIVESYYDEINYRMSGLYVAQSDYGNYIEATDKRITETAAQTTETIKDVRAIESKVTEINDMLIETEGYIKKGIIDEKDGVPIIGVEIGQTVEKDGVTDFSKYARFTSDKLSFYDQGGNEVAYVSDETLHITNVEIVAETDNATFRIGGFKDEAKNDGSVITRWVGV